MDINNIQNQYNANQIKVLAGLSAVRKRPAMYIGNTGIEGLHHLIYEVVDNSIDEALAGYCNLIKVIIHEDGMVTIEDNGRGIPVDIHPTEGISALELVMTRLHAGGKFDHQTYKVSGGLHGVGISVVNALSEYLNVEVYRNNKIYSQNYCKGNPINPIKIIGETKKQGTKITFKPDKEIFETTEFQFDILQARMRELAFLNPAITIELKDEKNDISVNYHFEGGIVEFVEYLNNNKELVNEKPIYIIGEKDLIQIEIAFQYNTGYSEKLLSYVNNIRTKDGGTHVAGFRLALTKCINKYANEDIIPKKLKEKMEGDDLREGLTCVISVKVPNPQFEGQTKTKLGNTEVRSIVASVAYEGISTFFEENPVVSKKILAKVVDAARAREAAKKARELARKVSLGQDMSMAGKLAECQEKDPARREIFLVEGDSAGGSAKQGRDRQFQAILPLKGKIMNVEKARFDKMLSSEEIKNLISSLGAGIGMDEFDINRLRYHKVIIMTDADVDGAHIRTLLLTFFYRQMISLIENGMLYIAQPPLYRVSFGKGKEIFLKDEEDLNNFLFKRISKEISIRPKGWDSSYKEEKLRQLLFDLSSYSKTLEDMAKKGCWKELCQDILELGLETEHQFEDIEFVKKLAEGLKKRGYKVGPVTPSNSVPFSYEISIGMDELAYLETTIGPDFAKMPEFHRILRIYKIISPIIKNGCEILVSEGIEDDGVNKHFSDVHEILMYIKTLSMKGLTIQRYKGLGEMNPDQLWETTMNPEKRTLLQVTIKDIGEAERLFTTLMGEKIEPRREFIQTHALEANDLDI
ncbi:MAG: DNA topoisomerase (ATP-hydrolyzing) subunit B [Dissulfurimicrobium sp.]|uniref:DNA topoisomerase (ATP-hydrolyzing) subunit B n=1 Tax=Dissulfurimicrobium sp. TaxID=2022436 RepID=UPI003D09E2D8